MPLPLLLIGAVALVGAGVGAAGAHDLATAKEKVKAAQKRHEEALDDLETARLCTQGHIEALGRTRLNVSAKTLQRFAKVMQRLGAQAKAKQRGQQHANLPPLTAHDLARFEKQGSAALELLKGTAQGVGTGAALAVGAGGMAATYGATAGGVAIASLNGAAATNATLAYIGGGALSAGGGGMAMGTAVLGGLALAPLFLLGGLALAKHGEKALTQACEYEADVDTTVAKLAQAIAVLGAVNARTQELDTLTTQLAGRLDQVVARLDAIPFWQRHKLSPAHEADIATAWGLASGLSRLLDVQLMNADGAPHSDVGAAIRDVRALATP